MSTTTARHRTTGHTRRSRTAVKVLASIALVAGAGAVAGVGTFGAFTDTTTADLTVSSGAVALLMNDSDQGVSVTASSMVPGDTIVFPVTIKRATGSAELGDVSVQTTITDNNALTSALRLSVDGCSVPWTVTGSAVTCSGTTTNISTASTLVGNGSTSAWGPTTSWVPALNGGGTLHLRATLSLPSSAGNSVQGLSTGVTWKVTGTQRTGKASVVVPATR